MGIENETRNDNLTNAGINEALAQAEISVLGAILCMALLGYLIVIVVLKEEIQWNANLFSQLVMDITLKFEGNNFPCKLVKPIYVHMLSLNLQTWTTKRVHFMTAIAMILSGFFLLPQLFIVSYKQSLNRAHDCIDNFCKRNSGQCRHLIPVYSYQFMLFHK
ncbi:ANR-like protein [Mya arenaria]|uniref:ANR-like protein n=1 Tax=Mya arenaria TaxID=6604 RepID=A0ABY7EP48_MYAAR|nr:ANR-like protein [Mya arenaria]